MTCPKCHASPLDWDKQKFRCGSHYYHDGSFQEAGVSGSCIMRQRDQLEFRVRQLTEALDSVAAIADRIVAAIPEYAHEMNIVRNARNQSK